MLKRSQVNKFDLYSIDSEILQTLGYWYGCYKKSGADPGFFLGGGALVSCSTSTPINHIVFFLQNTSLIRKPQVPSPPRLDPPLEVKGKTQPRPQGAFPWSSETCLGREEKIRQELQSQHFSGQRKEAKQIKFAIIEVKTAIFYVFVGSTNTIWVAPNNTPIGNI